MDSNKLKQVKWNVHHLGGLDLLVDETTLRINMIFKIDSNKPNKVNSINDTSIFGFHKQCNTSLIFAENMIICEKCKEVIPPESF